MRRAIVTLAIGVLIGLAVVWFVTSQIGPPVDLPVMNDIQRPSQPAR